MIYEVQFDDGSVTQINANNDVSARRAAVEKFRDKLVVSVKRAGLLGMAQRRPPVEIPKN
jgi:hypothetical protein